MITIQSSDVLSKESNQSSILTLSSGRKTKNANIFWCVYVWGEKNKKNRHNNKCTVSHKVKFNTSISIDEERERKNIFESIFMKSKN